MAIPEGARRVGPYCSIEGIDPNLNTDTLYALAQRLEDDVRAGKFENPDIVMQRITVLLTAAANRAGVDYSFLGTET